MTSKKSVNVGKSALRYSGTPIFILVLCLMTLFILTSCAQPSSTNVANQTQTSPSNGINNDANLTNVQSVNTAVSQNSTNYSSVNYENSSGVLINGSSIVVHPITSENANENLQSYVDKNLGISFKYPSSIFTLDASKKNQLILTNYETQILKTQLTFFKFSLANSTFNNFTQRIEHNQASSNNSNIILTTTNLKGKNALRIQVAPTNLISSNASQIAHTLSTDEYLVDLGDNSVLAIIYSYPDTNLSKQIYAQILDSLTFSAGGN